MKGIGLLLTEIMYLLRINNLNKDQIEQFYLVFVSKYFLRNIYFISISKTAKVNATSDVYVSSPSCGIIHKTNNNINKASIIVIGIVQKHIPSLKTISYTLFLKFNPTCFFKIFDKINNIKNSHKNVDKKYIRGITVFLQTIAAPIIAAIPGIGMAAITQCKMPIKLYIQRPNTQYPIIDKILQVTNLFK